MVCVVWHGTCTIRVMKAYQVKLINPEEPNGYYMVALVEAESAIEANQKAQAKHDGLLAIEAEVLE